MKQTEYFMIRPFNLTTSPGKASNWMRAMIGGGLSIFIVGIALFLVSLRTTSGITLFVAILLYLPGIFLHTWLLGDPYARLLPPEEAAAISQRLTLFALLAWFLLGFGLTCFIKSNKKAFGAWLMVIIMLVILVIVWM